jgi:hypothetical protein
MNRRRLAAIASLALALMGVAASGAGARSAAIVRMNVGDGLAIAGSKIQCGMSADVGYGLDLKGKRYIVCGPSTSTKGGGYIALMDSDGHVYILSIKTHKTVSSRMPASAVASATRSAGVTAKIGDTVALAGTPLLCDVLKVGGLPTLVCELVNAKGRIRGNSYSFGVSDSEVTSLRWDPAQHVHLLASWSER